MYNFTRLLVCLDLTDLDKNLISFASRFITNKVADKVYFIHVAKKLELASDILEKYPNLAAPVDETIKKIMQDKLNDHFDQDHDTYELLVAEGNAFDQIIRWSVIKEIDLILMGKKDAHEGSFELPEKIVKFTHNSVLIVTQSLPDQINTQLVPIDFSKNSAMAMQQAIKIKEITGTKITCFYMYDIPSGYHTTGKSYEEFSQIMESNAKKEFHNFAMENGFDHSEIPCIFSLSDGEHAKQILETAHSINAGLIVMGSKGRTQLSNLVLGSTAMKTVKYDLDIPLLVVKDKKHNLGFLEALFEL